MPPPITAQVATVRHKISLPANFQIASRQATTATRMQVLVVQNEIALTTSGFRKPLRILRPSNSFISFYCELAGRMIKSARAGPSSVTALMRNGRCRESSPTHMRSCNRSLCGSSGTVNCNIIAEIF